MGGAVMAVLLADDVGGHSPVPPLFCVLLAALAVSALLAARRRAPEDPASARALVVLGSGLAFAALSVTALVLAVFSSS
ncbi:MAG: hypothetical protein JHC74_06515 [Thermoleophilia bacterium]|nr:hypothetical protein [Thermoleophilia bacterium]